MSESTEKPRFERQRIRERYGEFFETVSSVLFKHDPIGINYEHNTDEYDPEAGTIIPRLESCNSVNDVCIAVHEEFVRWFSPHDAGPAHRYQQIAEELWTAWQRYQSSS